MLSPSLSIYTPTSFKITQGWLRNISSSVVTYVEQQITVFTHTNHKRMHNVFRGFSCMVINQIGLCWARPGKLVDMVKSHKK